MFVPVLAGWGKDARVVCPVGFLKCAKCKNMTLFELVETKRRVSAFFVPVAKFGRRFLTVCPVCSATTEQTEESAEQIIQAAKNLPSSAKLMELSKKIDVLFMRHLVVAVGGGDVELASKRIAEARDITPAMIDGAAASMRPDLEALGGAYAPEHVEYVRRKYFEHWADPDKPA